MSATATQQPPAIPPRPSRNQDKTSMPMVPPRPTNRHIERSVSPNPDRFAPSPLNESPLVPKSRPSRYGANARNGDSIDRSKSVDLPSVGEEGKEYASLAAAAELSEAREQQNSSPEHTRTVGQDLKLHAPKPSLPAVSAKQRVMTVTRTDSDRAASFGIGRPSSNEDSTPALPSNRSLKKKASTTSQLSQTESNIDDEHGIPEIGQQVPMYKNAGDVQAPSPAPGADGQKTKHHTRKTSGRGILPPGSYGLHGHGVVSQDKLDKAYYEKHPDLLKKERAPHHHDRVKDFSLSKDDLNKIVRETANRGSGLASKNYDSTPSDQVGWQAIEESTSRVASPRLSVGEFKPTLSVSEPDREARRLSEDGDVIHVSDPNHRRSVTGEAESSGTDGEEERAYTAPILAEDEVAKHPAPYDYQPAVEPQESTSRPTSRPASIYKESSFEMRSTPLEDVEEYEPLFNEEENEKSKQLTAEGDKAKAGHKKRFPSSDVWEDAPSSVHYTAEVSTPEPSEEQSTSSSSVAPPARSGETSAQAFARHQEELAEREAQEKGPEGFVPGRNKQKPVWAQHQAHLVSESSVRPAMSQRFPSQDVWEDAPESLRLETTVSTPQQDNEPSPVESKPESPSASEKPAIPERPKPQVPARPAKAGPTSGGLEPAEAAAPPRQKPAVPTRPTGSKIAALKAGFMSDLNNRLRLGPQAPKKEEAAAEEPVVEEKEKAPLSDARKGRARGPQRRAPAKSASPGPAAAAPADEAPKFNFSMTVTVFDVDPEEGTLNVGKPILSQKVIETSEEPKEQPREELEEAAEKVIGAQNPETSSSGDVASEDKKDAADEPKPEPEAPEQTQASESPAKAVEETKSLVTNTAGEPLVQETVKKDEEHQQVEPTKVEQH
ncbi:altered inheritance of mitochondria protein 21 [Cercophora scortea]|uniref:Altered inheritance of mitochondria protein 21 n=1 Tax=Cercophora scortea TaxID=314031 RepID=A0AAE0IW67_9PEZI|nr:altered inheritance of mitochondria protein 21 [Cercophora scortea]